MKNYKSTALKLIFLFGIISLLGDIIYEGARSVNGPYLQTLGANAAIVGLVAGIGEFLGYAVRLVSGYFSDKIKAYWLFTILGYSLLLVVPLLSLTGIWQFAAIFIVLERIGKGIRSPAKDTILSHAAKQVGTGFGFAIAEFLDQIGATLGPLIFTFVFIFLSPHVESLIGYQQGYGLLWFPFVLLMLTLFTAFFLIKNPEELETNSAEQQNSSNLPEKLTPIFWHYAFFTFFTTLGFINFVLVGYHLKAAHIASDAVIPLLYSLAMVVDAFMGLIVGRIYDRLKTKYKNQHSGLLVLLIIPFLTLLVSLFIFSSQLYLVVVGVFLWGCVMGTHETIMKAGIADLTSIKKRGTGYGIFNTTYGFALMIGSALAGFLYEFSIPLLIFMLVSFEIIALIIFYKMSFLQKNTK